MFIRKKKNKSGTFSIQIIDTSERRGKILHIVGVAKSNLEVTKLISEAEVWIANYHKQSKLNFTSDTTSHIFNVLESIESITIAGVELVLGKLFDDIGFNKISDLIFKQLVLARLAYPSSKLKTVDLISKYQFLNIDINKIYRYLDKLYDSQKSIVEQISFDHTLTVLNNQINVVFYDVTTLYFEIENEDDLRKTGFSKEGRHKNPQILLGLLVSEGGYPIAYDIFEGNSIETDTIIPIIDKFKKKYNLDNLVIVADSGLISKKILIEIESLKYEYIIGARIKNETNEFKQKIFNLNLKDGEIAEINKTSEQRILIHYSLKRAVKDSYNRLKGINKLEKSIQSGKLKKSNINNRGYNKFLAMKGEVEIKLNPEKIEQDKKWDGLKGYITNSKENKESIIKQYNQLWQIELAFRISKSELNIRPIYHRKRKRIEAHICISFVALKIRKELERQLKLMKSELSAEKCIEIAKTIYKIRVNNNNLYEKPIEKVLLLTEEHKLLAKLFNF
jgi:transposase